MIGIAGAWILPAEPDEPMSLTRRALWVIERNLGRELSLGEIAQACGVSRHHLAHAFGEATGRPVMAYVRGRRLAQAADALAAGAGNILDLALEGGYGSHEAFSRAFKAEFGATPESVRRAGSTAGLPLLAAIELDEDPTPALSPRRVVEAGPILAVGVAGRHALDRLQGIPDQWRRFGPHFLSLPDRAADAPIGVMSSLDEAGGFDYLSAAEVTTFANAPAEFERHSLPAAAYAVFPHPGHVSGIRRTYAAIWNHWPQDGGWLAGESASLERHCDSFDPRTGEGGLEVWIPLVRA